MENQVEVSREELEHALAGFSAILTPVTLTMVLSALSVQYLTPDAEETFQDSSLILNDENEAESDGEQISSALINALVIIGAITAMTFVIVFLYWMGMEMIFGVYIFLAMMLLLGFTTGVVVVEGLSFYKVPTDLASTVIFFYNYAVVGVVAIFSFEVGFQGPVRLVPLWVTQVYLVLISVVMAWLVTTMFPEFTTWALLICLALYDLCAVLTPCGPLNLLIKVVSSREEREGNNDRQMLAGMLYEVGTGRGRGQPAPQQSGAAAAGPLAFATEPGSLRTTPTSPTFSSDDDDEMLNRAENNADAESEQKPPANYAPRPPAQYANHPSEFEDGYEYELEGSNLKLGLGDFVFYSVLTAKSAEFGFVAFISVACCVLCGLCGTLILLSVFQKALPALPISIALGVATYVIANTFISPFFDALLLEQLSI